MYFTRAHEYIIYARSSSSSRIGSMTWPLPVCYPAFDRPACVAPFIAQMHAVHCSTVAYKYRIKS